MAAVSHGVCVFFVLCRVGVVGRKLRLRWYRGGLLRLWRGVVERRQWAAAAAPRHRRLRGLLRPHLARCAQHCDDTAFRCLSPPFTAFHRLFTVVLPHLARCAHCDSTAFRWRGVCALPAFFFAALHRLSPPCRGTLTTPYNPPTTFPNNPPIGQNTTTACHRLSTVVLCCRWRALALGARRAAGQAQLLWCKIVFREWDERNTHPQVPIPIPTRRHLKQRVLFIILLIILVILFIILIILLLMIILS